MKRSWSSLMVAVAYASAAGSIVISLAWLAKSPAVAWFEPALQALGLLACLSGVVVERRAAGRERRGSALAALAGELAKCASVLDDARFAPRESASPRPQVYPRLPVSATNSILISGALADRRYAALLPRLHNWHDVATGFNRRLDLTELRLFTVGLRAEIAEFERVLDRDRGYVYELRNQVNSLLGDLEPFVRHGRGRRRQTRRRVPRLGRVFRLSLVSNKKPVAGVHLRKLYEVVMALVPAAGFQVRGEPAKSWPQDLVAGQGQHRHSSADDRVEVSVGSAPVRGTEAVGAVVGHGHRVDPCPAE